MFMLVNVIISIVLAVLDIALGTDGDYDGVLGTLYSLAVLVPSLAVGARRLHGIGRTGWWQLLGIIPLVGLIVLIVWWAKAGEPSPNEWRSNPWDAPQPV